MFRTILSVGAAAALGLAMTGCCGEEVHTVRTARACDNCGTKTAVKTERSERVADLPPNAEAGECYAKVFIPAKYNTVTERICKRQASERLEITPAQYEWVDQRVCVKEGGKELIEQPAQFETREKTVQVTDGHTGWELNTSGECRTESGQPAHDVFCLVNHPAETRTVETECLAKPACVKEVAIEPEFQTIRMQRLVSPAKVNRVAVPAEYEDVQKTVLVSAAHMEWQRVICERDSTQATANAVKDALMANGYPTDSPNGQLSDRDWHSLKKFQQDRGLGVGPLSYETLNALGVAMR